MLKNMKLGASLHDYRGWTSSKTALGSEEHRYE